MKTPDKIQQGDVLLKPVNALPKNCVRLETRTIAHGEISGHHHTFDEGVVLFEKPESKNHRRLVFAVNETDAPVHLRHQEHNMVILAPHQVYQFGQVREKDWFTEMVRPVID